MAALDPFLPTDIEQEIFEISALTHPRSIPALFRVARRVKTWIEPFLYRIVTLGKTFETYPLRYQVSAPAFLDMLESKPTSFWHERIRHMFVSHMIDDDAFRILSLYHSARVSNLFLFSGVAEDHRFLPFLTAMPLARLSASLQPLFRSAIDFAHPVFARLTHLETFDIDYSDYSPVDFGRLPCLTHISFNFPSAWASQHPFFEEVLANSAALKVFILLTYGDEETREVMSEFAYFGDDTRAVVLDRRHVWGDWETGAEGGADYWVRAERFIKQRQSGEIPASDFVLFANPVVIDEGANAES
ncbi:hypothetical protein B0H11DRAFT_2020508 [Mycena galericulata]|nr:hypothetical protein B0H11DRAFT_2020508 [Mycena galericulata]